MLPRAIALLPALLIASVALSGCVNSEGGDADTLQGLDADDFVRSNQACPSGQLVSGANAVGGITCAADQTGGGGGVATDADTVDGQHASAFALRNQACGVGQVMNGINAAGAATCVTDQTGGGGVSSNADTLDGLDSTAFARSATFCAANDFAYGIDASGFVQCDAVLRDPVGVAIGSNAYTATGLAYAIIGAVGEAASVSITVPSGETALVQATFSAESNCYGSTDYCSVRLLLDGTEMSPAAGTDFAFDSSDSDTESFFSWESHSMTRTLVVGSGVHSITAEAAIVGVGAGTSFRLDDWTLFVEAHLL